MDARVLAAGFGLAVVLFIGTGSGETEVPRSAPDLKPSTYAADIKSGQDVCMYIEAVGNRQPGKSLRCVYEPDSNAGGQYTLTVSGDHEGDELSVRIALASETASRNALAGLNSRQLTLVFSAESEMHGTSSALLSDLRACSAKGAGTEKQLCLIRLLA